MLGCFARGVEGFGFGALGVEPGVGFEPPPPRFLVPARVRVGVVVVSVTARLLGLCPLLE